MKVLELLVSWTRHAVAALVTAPPGDADEGGTPAEGAVSDEEAATELA